MARDTRPFICGNWKLHKTIAESLDAGDRRCATASAPLRDVEVAVAPGFTALHAVAKRLEDGPVARGGAGLLLGGQGRLHRRGVAVAARRRRLQLRHRRPLRAAPALRRARRGGEPQGARGAARRPRARSSASARPGRARRGRDLRPHPGRSSTARSPTSTDDELARVRRSPTSRSGPSAPAAPPRRRRRRRCTPSFAAASATRSAALAPRLRIQYGGSVKPDNAARSWPSRTSTARWSAARR